MQVTTTTGATVAFNPNRVFMITGPLPSDTVQVCYIHGISPAPFPRIAGSIPDFVNLLPDKTHFIPLHFWNTGGMFYANAHQIHSVSGVEQLQQASHPNANAVIALGGKHRYVVETVDEVRTTVNAAGGNL